MKQIRNEIIRFDLVRAAFVCQLRPRVKRKSRSSLSNSWNWLREAKSESMTHNNESGAVLALTHAKNWFRVARTGW
jgi:hypothetical protein